jgi:hypothetical protein
VAHIAASDRKPLRDAVSNMTWRAAIRRERLPEIDRWLAAQPGARP